MSSAGRAASSSGCVGRPRGHETGLTDYAEQTQRSLLTGSSAMETAEHREPYESRGSRTDLGAPRGATPLGDSTFFTRFGLAQGLQAFASRRAKSRSSQRRSRPKLWPAAASAALMPSPWRPLRWLRPIRCSALMWPMTGCAGRRGGAPRGGDTVHLAADPDAELVC